MRNPIAHGLASILLVVSLGAAQGPTSSRSKDTQGTTPSNAVAGSKYGPRAKTIHHPYQVGTASWYGEYFEGRATASGEPYNMHDLTAAHPTLPLGSWVRVTNLRNGRIVYVRINDRGPIVPGRIIDLSYGAAQVLNFRDKGLQRVRLDLATPREAAPQQLAMLQSLAY
ncbi:MAG TPA: septal ring lytic transglycosylase RlpA family protein [Terriglobales bacterium]|jgi:rare lipoprotein A|nr:septal ring lytic transglycosylase RlpA family protein [Terriglobales bacterium]